MSFVANDILKEFSDKLSDILKILSIPDPVPPTNHDKGPYYYDVVWEIVQKSITSLETISSSVIIPGGGLTWINYVSEWATAPVELTSISGGNVFRYERAGGDIYYRLVPEPYIPENDAFYQNFDGSTLSDLLIQRSETIILGP